MKKYAFAVLLLTLLSWLPAPTCFAEDASVLKRLDEISQNQKQILEALEQVKSELQIVKVRITSR